MLNARVWWLALCLGCPSGDPAPSGPSQPVVATDSTEPAYARGPVFASATVDRYGDALPERAVARLGTIAGEREPPSQTTADGKVALVCDYNGQSACDLRDTATRELIGSIPPLDSTHDWYLEDAFFAGKHVIIHWNDRTVAEPVSPSGVTFPPEQLRIHRVVDGSLVTHTELPRDAKVFATDAHMLVTAGGQADLYALPKLGTPRRLARPSASGAIRWAAIASDAPRIAGYLEPAFPNRDASTLVIWDADTLAVLSEVPLRCRSLGLSPNGDAVACASRDPADELAFDRAVTIVSAADGRVQQTLASGRVERDLVFSADGTRLKTSLGAPVVSEWNLVDGSCDALQKGHLAEIDSIAIADDGEDAVVLDVHGELRVWSLRDQTTRWRRTLPSAVARTRAVAFSADGANVHVAALSGCELTVLRRDDGETVGCVQPPASVDTAATPPLSARRSRLQVHFGDELVLTERGPVAVAQDGTGKEIRRYELGTEPLTAIVGTKDGRVAIGDASGAIAVFDAMARPIAHFDHGDAPVTALAFHPTQSVLFSGGGDGNLLIWR